MLLSLYIIRSLFCGWDESFVEIFYLKSGRKNTFSRVWRSVWPQSCFPLRLLDAFLLIVKPNSLQLFSDILQTKECSYFKKVTISSHSIKIMIHCENNRKFTKSAPVRRNATQWWRNNGLSATKSHFQLHRKTKFSEKENSDEVKF